MEKPNRVFLLLLRLALAGYFLMAGGMKVSNGFSADAAVGMVKRATGFYDVFTGGLLPLTNFLITWGEVLLGVSLLLGVSMRLSTTLGAVMVGLFYLFVGGQLFDNLLIVLLALLVVGYSKHHLYALSNHKNACANKACPCRYLPN